MRDADPQTAALAPENLFQGSACDVISETAKPDDEPVHWKGVNSAFIGTGLEGTPRERGFRRW